MGLKAMWTFSWKADDLFSLLEGVSSKHTTLRIHVKMCSKITKEVHSTTVSDIVAALITYLLYLISKKNQTNKKTHTTQAVSLQFSSKEVPMQCGSGQGCAAEIKETTSFLCQETQSPEWSDLIFLSSTVKRRKSKIEHRVPLFFLMLGEPPSSGRWKLRQIDHGYSKICFSGLLSQACLWEFSS